MATISLMAYENAERSLAKVEARRGVTVHAVVTAAIAVILIAVNVLVTSSFPWSAFAVVGMGVGLVFHYYFGFVRIDENVEVHQRRVEQLAEAS